MPNEINEVKETDSFKYFKTGNEGSWDHENPAVALRDFWLIEKGGTMRELAREVGVTPAALYYWLRGHAIPKQRWKRIREVTQGRLDLELQYLEAKVKEYKARHAAT